MPAAHSRAHPRAPFWISGAAAYLQVRFLGCGLAAIEMETEQLTNNIAEYYGLISGLKVTGRRAA